MADRMSNRERIARMQSEAAARSREREQKQKKEAAKRDARPRSSAKQEPGRIRIVWAVCDPSGAHVRTFPYAQEAEAHAEAQQRTESTGRPHFVTRAEEPIT